MWMSSIPVPRKAVVKSRRRNEVKQLVRALPVVEAVEHAQRTDVAALTERPQTIGELGIADDSNGSSL